MGSGHSRILISRLEFSRKRYYSRISKLINAGLIRRKNGKYFLTSFGSIVYEAQDLIGKAVRFSSKLKAIDSIETPEIPAEERSEIIDTLINNSKIKEILINPRRNNNYIAAEKEKA